MKSPAMESVDLAVLDLLAAVETAAARVRRVRDGGTITRDACGSADRQPMRPILKALDAALKASDALQEALGIDFAEEPHYGTR